MYLRYATLRFVHFTSCYIAPNEMVFGFRCCGVKFLFFGWFFSPFVLFCFVFHFFIFLDRCLNVFLNATTENSIWTIIIIVFEYKFHIWFPENPKTSIHTRRCAHCDRSKYKAENLNYSVVRDTKEKEKKGFFKIFFPSSSFKLQNVYLSVFMC